jgi:hypothetical protein
MAACRAETARPHTPSLNRTISPRGPPGISRRPSPSGALFHAEAHPPSVRAGALATRAAVDDDTAIAPQLANAITATATRHSPSQPPRGASTTPTEFARFVFIAANRDRGSPECDPPLLLAPTGSFPRSRHAAMIDPSGAHAVARGGSTRDHRRKVRSSRIFAVGVLLAIAGCTAPADGSTAGKLPAPAKVDCGNSGVMGAGFTVYSCESGAGGTKYAHPAELLVVRPNGSYTGYPDAFSQSNLVSKSDTGEVVAAHNDAIVRVTASALTTLVDERRLDRLFPGSPDLAGIDALTVDSSGDIFLRANYYAAQRHGCGNVRVELTAAGRLKLLWRSPAGLTCG